MRVGQLVRALFALFSELTLLFVFCTGSTFAQNSETGLPPFGSFHGGGIDLVSLQNGNLHIEVPAFTVHRRALRDDTANLTYDISSWSMDEYSVTNTTFQWTAAPTPHQLQGWHLLSNLLGVWHVDHDTVNKTCTSSNGNYNYKVDVNYTVTDRHGTVHPFEVRHVEHVQGEPCTDQTDSQSTGVALDGSGITLAIGANAYNTTTTIPDDDGPLNGNSFGVPGFTETDQNDANGHLITTTWSYM